MSAKKILFQVKQSLDSSEIYEEKASLQVNHDKLRPTFIPPNAKSKPMLQSSVKVIIQKTLLII